MVERVRFKAKHRKMTGVHMVTLFTLLSHLCLSSDWW